MVLFLSFFLILLRFGPNFVFHSGYYLFAGFYAAQRFAWEFFKPYETLFLGLNIFHLLCLLLVAYSISMIMRTVKYKSRYETGIA